MNLADAPQYVEEVSSWLWAQWARTDGYRLGEIVYRAHHTMGSGGVPQMLVAERSGEPVGVVSLWYNDAKTRRALTPWLAALYIRPDCRGEHIGQALQTACTLLDCFHRTLIPCPRFLSYVTKSPEMHDFEPLLYRGTFPRLPLF